MTKPTMHAVHKIAYRFAKVTPHNTSQKAIYGLLVGATYGLPRAFDLGYVDRTGDALPSAYDQELVRVAQGLATSTDVAEQSWLAGFYFNSSLLRLAPACERLGKYARARKDLIPSVREEVNRIKHDVDGLLGGRKVSPDQMLEAASILTTAVSMVFAEK